MSDIAHSLAQNEGFQRARAWLPYIAAALLFGLGLYALHRLLAPVDLADVRNQIAATNWSTLGLAFLATFGGYLALAGYDWSALRHIGKPLPTPVVLTGGLMAYALGNTIGLSAISGGAVRWRIYSGLGLDGFDVAAVSAFTAISWGLAATLIGFTALAIHPDALGALAPVSPGMIRLISLAGMGAIVLPVFWASVSGRTLRIARFKLRAPSLPVLCAQVVFSLCDIGLSALTLYVLLPDPAPDFLTFLAVFSAAVLAGIISHVPGGVGVFETVVIASMPFGAPVDQVAAALLLFRMIYYLAPFTIALIVLAAYETWRALGKARPAGRAGRLLYAIEPGLSAVTPLVPLALAAMIFGSGLWLSLEALLPSGAEAAEAFFPLVFDEGAELLSSAFGAALIVLAVGVARRSEGAFWLASGALGGGVLAAISGTDDERAGALSLALAILLLFRRAFRRRSVLIHSALTPGWVMLVLTSLISFSFVLFFAHKGTAWVYELWWQFALDESAPRAIRAGLVSSLFIGLASLFILLKTPRYRPHPPGGRDLAQAAKLIRAWGPADSCFALTGDKSLIFCEDQRAVLSFAPSGRSWLAYGAPVGPPAAVEELAYSFAASARNSGALPVFWRISGDYAPVMRDLGLVLHPMGDEAIIDLTSYEAAPVPAGCAVSHPPHSDALIAELSAVSQAWLEARGAKEKAFSTGRFDPAWLGRWPVAVLRENGRILGFANIITGADGGACADLIRYAPDAPADVIRILVNAMLAELKAGGAKSFSLGATPLSGRAPERSRRIWERAGALLYRHGVNFASFDELRAFKESFNPEWRPVYVAAPPALSPLAVLADVTRLIGPAGPQSEG